MNLERVKAIYVELERYEVQLHPDPRTLGPTYLTDLIATTRNYLNAVSRVQLEIHQEKQSLAREIRAREAALQVASDELLANDERVRRLPSIEDRKATVSVFLRADKQVIENLKASMQDVEYVEKAIRHRHKELTSTMSEIKLQRSLIRDEIDTGAMYGDERVYGSKTVGNPAGIQEDDLNEEALLKLLAIESPGEVLALPVASTPTSDQETEAIATFLGDTEENAPRDDDFTSVFENL